MSSPRKRAAAYTTEHPGVHRPRPELEALIREAARRPRPFDVVMVQRIDMLGTPEDAHSAVARLAEFGVDLIAAIPVPTPFPSGILLSWLQRPPPAGPRPYSVEHIRRILLSGAINSPTTKRVVMDHLTAVRLYRDPGNPPQEILRTLTWPFDEPTYIEYSEPITLATDGHDADEQRQLLHGLIIRPGPPPRSITAVHTQGAELNLLTAAVDLQTASATIIDNALAFAPPYLVQDHAQDIAQAMTALAALIAHPGSTITELPDTGDQALPWHILLPPPDQRYPIPAEPRP